MRARIGQTKGVVFFAKFTYNDADDSPMFFFINQASVRFNLKNMKAYIYAAGTGNLRSKVIVNADGLITDPITVTPNPDPLLPNIQSNSGEFDDGYTLGRSKHLDNDVLVSFPVDTFSSRYCVTIPRPDDSRLTNGDEVFIYLTCDIVYR